MIPGTRYPGPSRPGTAPVPLVPGVPSSCPDPVAVDPNITGAGGYGVGIDNIGRLGLYVPIRCAAGEAQKAAGDSYAYQ